MGGEEWARRRGVVAGAGTGVDRASRKVGKEEMTTAGVGGGEEREGGDSEGGEEEEEEGRGLIADRSTSRGEEEGVGTARVRPSNPMV